MGLLKLNRGRDKWNGFVLSESVVGNQEQERWDTTLHYVQGPGGTNWMREGQINSILEMKLWTAPQKEKIVSVG